jgi:hypothetical protein
LEIPGSFTSLGSEGSELHLSNAVDAGGEPLNGDDFTFQLFINDGKTMDGIVVQGTLPPETIAGDYTGDGRVDGNDFLAWQRQAELAAAYCSFQWDVTEFLAI